MPRPLDGATGERLERAAYREDFAGRYAQASEFWKLEVGQVFAEPGSESWEAFGRGEWGEALRLLEERRPLLADLYEKDAARGMAYRRVRIVRLPPTGYLQWELHSLKIRDELGGKVRVLRGDEVAELEDQAPLPDINVIGTDAAYRVIYNGDGAADHAIRYTDKVVVQRCRDFIADLYERGEPIGEFFQREIAQLPPPVRHEIPHHYLKRTGPPQAPRV